MNGLALFAGGGGGILAGTLLGWNAMFLTDAQVRRLTGEQEKSAQVRWLVKEGVRHWVNACGKPVVPCSAIDTPWKSEPQGWAPDFSRMKCEINSRMTTTDRNKA